MGADDAKPKQNARRLLVILHGARIFNAEVRSAVERLNTEGYDITVRVTYQGGDVERLVNEAFALGSVDTLVAAGGDGTLTEVVEALLKHPDALEHTSVALLPLGTCNSFAATTGIPIDPYEALVLATDPEKIHPIDVGLLNGRVFMNTATAGASTDLGKLTSGRLKFWLGPAAFFITGAKAVVNWRPVKADLSWAHPKDAKQSQPPEAAAETGAGQKDTGEDSGAVITPKQAPEPPTTIEGAADDDSKAAGDQAEGGAAAGRHKEGAAQVTTAATAGTTGAKKFGKLPGEGGGEQGGKATQHANVDAAKPGKGACAGAGAGDQTTTEPGAADAAPETAKDPQRMTSLEKGAAAAKQQLELRFVVAEKKGVELLNVTAANNRQIGSQVVVAPHALLDDGMLDIVYLKGNLIHQVSELCNDILKKGCEGEFGDMTLLRAPWFEVKFSDPTEWSRDGETDGPPETTLRFEVLPRAIKMHLPDDRLLVGGTAAGPNKKLVPRGRLKPGNVMQMLNAIKLRRSNYRYYLLMALPVVAGLCFRAGSWGRLKQAMNKEVEVEA